jgi:hypothetical protein
MGYEGGYVRAIDPFELTQLPGDTITLKGGNLRYGFTTGNTNTEAGINPGVKGRGFGLDVGALYIEDEDRWRAGLAITGGGYVHFGPDAQTHAITHNMTWRLVQSEFDGVTDLAEAARILSSEATGSPEGTRTGSGFTLGTPLRITLHGDYQLTDHFRIGGSWQQRARLSPLMLPALNQIMIYPRFESKYFTAGVHLGLIEYDVFRMGVSARLGWLVIGMDDMISFFHRSRLRSGDVYFALKVQPFNMDWADHGGQDNNGRARRHKKGKNIGCYEF